MARAPDINGTSYERTHRWFGSEVLFLVFLLAFVLFRFTPKMQHVILRDSAPFNPFLVRIVNMSGTCASTGLTDDVEDDSD